MSQSAPRPPPPPPVYNECFLPQPLNPLDPAAAADADGWGFSSLGANTLGPQPNALKYQIIGLLHAVAYLRGELVGLGLQSCWWLLRAADAGSGLGARCAAACACAFGAALLDC